LILLDAPVAAMRKMLLTYEEYQEKNRIVAMAHFAESPAAWRCGFYLARFLMLGGCKGYNGARGLIFKE
jgi:hypothetical protein